MSAEERRESVLDAAVAEFSKGGLAGTSTEVIAARAGISQPYLFRLFVTKKELFIASFERAFATVERRFIEAAEGLTGHAALDAMAEAYHALLVNRDLLLCQLHTYAASDDAEVRAAAQSAYGRLWRTAETASGADEGSLRLFFAMGMLWNVAVALDLPDLGEPWAKAIMGTESVRTGKNLAGLPAPAPAGLPAPADRPGTPPDTPRQEHPTGAGASS
ncbi:MAG: TetR/AcrR family transcriptional regulator [Streptosporangiaceae bacterium]